MKRDPSSFDFVWSALTGFFGVLLSLAPMGVSANAPVGPNWLFLILAFWAARRPHAVPPLLVFALGLLNDMIRDGPIGAELFALLVAIELLRGVSERRPPITFMSEWTRFAVAAAALAGVAWALLAVTYARTPPIEALAQQIGLSILAYPIACYPLEKLFRTRIREGRFDHLRF